MSYLFKTTELEDKYEVRGLLCMRKRIGGLTSVAGTGKSTKKESVRTKKSKGLSHVEDQ